MPCIGARMNFTLLGGPSCPYIQLFGEVVSPCDTGWKVRANDGHTYAVHWGGWLGWKATSRLI